VTFFSNSEELAMPSAEKQKRTNGFKNLLADQTIDEEDYDE